MTVDGAGNLYVADSSNQTVRKIAPGGVVTTLAGMAGVRGAVDGTGSAARFATPIGVAVNSAGDVYVADLNNQSVRKVTSAGAVSVAAGTPGFFNGPAGVAVDAAGNVYVAEWDNFTIRKVNADGLVTTLAGLARSLGSSDGAGSAARFSSPQGVAVDGAGSVYVADSGNSTIRKIGPDGVVSTLAGSPFVSGSADGTGSAARFRYPRGIAVDGAGTVYVADHSNYTIRKITPGGVVTTLAGLAGAIGHVDGTGSAARFAFPFGVAVDGAGTLYVSDGSDTIRRVTSDGMVTTIAGSPYQYGSADGIGSAARFHGPRGMAIDGAGNVYVADSANNTIRRIAAGGIVTTLAGSAGISGADDGRGSDAQFNSPSGLAINSSGVLYVGDTSNQTIRVALAYTAVSRKLHGGTPFDIDLPLTGPPGIECRSGGTTNDYQVVVACYRPVTVNNASVTSGSGQVVSASGSGSSTLIMNLTGVTSGQTIALTLSGVNDGSSTHDLVIPMGVLVGDTNDDGFVNAGDALQTRNRSGQATNDSNFRSDVNADGFVNSGDTLVVRRHSGTSLP